MTEPTGFSQTVWKKLRPHAIVGVVDFGQYVILWAGVLGAHGVTALVAIAGVDPEIIKFVSFMEKWLWIASFVSFLWRIATRAWRVLRGSTR
jgi:hypothetical protein